MASASSSGSVSPSLPPTSQGPANTLSVPLKNPGTSSVLSFGSIKFQDRSKDEISLRGQPKPLKPSRVRESSPPPARRFQSHVSFDNFASGEQTDQNTIAFTLNSRHNGYHYKRGSRTFMVGVDEHVYSDYALQWMLDELVDDGDEIVCVRVVDKDAKINNDKSMETKQYQEEAHKLMQTIQLKNDENRAISIVLEFAVGKLHATFQKMIQIYEPGMLIVGTRGRSLGGFQGLVGNRNSFSKWCLQYSPIPVVVVRPTEKREKKKLKRTLDPSRQSYLQILYGSGNEVHEIDVSGSNTPRTDPLLSNNPDAEAHAVAAALALPARFDPTLKPLDLDHMHTLRKTTSGKSDATTTTRSGSRSPPSSPEATFKIPLSDTMDSPAISAGEESDEEEGEFEAVLGESLLEPTAVEKKEKLHMMEVGEAAVFAAGRKSSIESVSSTESGSGSGNNASTADDKDGE